ncbi:hypothetical protein H6G51_08870 [Limnothrix sp. FACHB-708]|nr:MULTISPECIES: hypothetical protein [unclassified Limnothrix]MBD2553386.1 hypothetical protein [Limnothrix sp. FACHB-708]
MAKGVAKFDNLTGKTDQQYLINPEIDQSRDKDDLNRSNLFITGSALV